MQKFVNRCAGICAGLLLSGLASAGAVAAEPEFGVCETQLLADVKARFGQEIRDIRYTWAYDGKNGEADYTSSAVVYPEGCNGYCWYELWATYERCEVLPNYGTPPSYVAFRSPNRGCR